MRKIVNYGLDLTTSGLELAAVFVAGLAPVAPIFKMLLCVVPILVEMARHFVKLIMKKGTYHV